MNSACHLAESRSINFMQVVPGSSTVAPPENRTLTATPNTTEFVPTGTSAPNVVSTLLNSSGVRSMPVACRVCKQRGKVRKWRLDLDRDKMVKDGWQDCPTCEGRLWTYATESVYYSEPIPQYPTPPFTPSPTIGPWYYSSENNNYQGGELPYVQAVN